MSSLKHLMLFAWKSVSNSDCFNVTLFSTALPSFWWPCRFLQSRFFWLRYW